MLISSTRLVAALLTHSASARNGRAIWIKSALPSSSRLSAVSGILIRLEAITGTLTRSRTYAVTSANAARGTEVTIVGMRASCQPMPLPSKLIPALSRACAMRTTSSMVLPSCTKSSIDKRKQMMNFSPTACRIAWTISTASRIRLSIEPPH